MKDDTSVNQTTTTLVDKKIPGLYLPRVCLLCGANCDNPFSLCTGCIVDLPRLDMACPACGLPMPAKILCAHCLKNKRNPINDTKVLFNYRYPVNLLIQRIKFHADLVVAGNLGRLMANRLLSEGIDMPECIVPVPLHPLRQALRGYNQALEIARPIARTFGLPLDYTLCKRIRYTHSQTSLTITERKRNLRNAFVLNNRNDYHRIAIVDDVMTTGSTIKELAKLFRDSGAVSIQAWVCARASTQ